MSNPDNNTTPNVDTMLIALPVAVLFLLITIFLFIFREAFGSFKLVLWFGLLLTTFVITTGVNFISQYIVCKQVNAGRAFLGTVPAIIAILIGLGIATISYCRIPIATVFAPLIVKTAVDVTKNKGTPNANIAALRNTISKAANAGVTCCTPKITLESLESKYPLIAGLSYGFYVMFSILFGVVIGSNLAIIC